VASKAFWISYSAYCRASRPRVIDNLLKLLSEECEASWYEQGSFRLAWRELYDNMVRFYVNKVMQYGEKYMNSAAGIALKANLDKSRRRHGTLPAVDEGTILRFEGAEGLHWSMDEVSDFFKILSEYTSTTPFKAIV